MMPRLWATTELHECDKTQDEIREELNEDLATIGVKRPSAALAEQGQYIGGEPLASFIKMAIAARISRVRTWQRLCLT